VKFNGFNLKQFFFKMVIKVVFFSFGKQHLYTKYHPFTNPVARTKVAINFISIITLLILMQQNL